MTGIEAFLTDQGFMGAAIFVLLGVCGALWKRLTVVQDARFDDIKTHAKEVSEVAREATRAMDGLRMVLEVKRDV